MAPAALLLALLGPPRAASVLLPGALGAREASGSEHGHTAPVRAHVADRRAGLECPGGYEPVAGELPAADQRAPEMHSLAASAAACGGVCSGRADCRFFGWNARSQLCSLNADAGAEGPEGGARCARAAGAQASTAEDEDEKAAPGAAPSLLVAKGDVDSVSFGMPEDEGLPPPRSVQLRKVLPARRTALDDEEDEEDDEDVEDYEDEEEEDYEDEEEDEDEVQASGIEDLLGHEVQTYGIKGLAMEQDEEDEEDEEYEEEEDDEEDQDDEDEGQILGVKGLVDHEVETYGIKGLPMEQDDEDEEGDEDEEDKEDEEDEEDDEDDEDDEDNEDGLIKGAMSPLRKHEQTKIRHGEVPRAGPFLGTVGASAGLEAAGPELQQPRNVQLRKVLPFGIKGLGSVQGDEAEDEEDAEEEEEDNQKQGDEVEEEEEEDEA